MDKKELKERAGKASDTLDNIADKVQPLIARMFASRFTWAVLGFALAAMGYTAYRLVNMFL